MYGEEVVPMAVPNVFGFSRYFLKFSPFNCGKGPLRFLFVIFSLAAFLSMIFRIYWMFWRVQSDLLSFGWAEKNLFAFISFESFCCVIGLHRISSKGLLKKFELKIAEMKKMRMDSKNTIHDDYGAVWRKLFLLCAPIPVFFVLTSVYLVANKIVIYDTTTESTWYYYYDLGVMFLCGYVNFLFLPIHAFRHSAMTREFTVFNEELQKASENKELTNSQLLLKFSDRQVKLFEFTNYMTERIETLMMNAPFLILTALANVSFLVTSLSDKTDLLYWLCLLGDMICCIIIASCLMYPPAFVQEAMLKTSRILMSDSLLQHSTDPRIYSTYRMIIDRSLHNRSVNTVIRIFSISRKNIERAFFVITNITLAMAVFYNLTFPKKV